MAAVSASPTGALQRCHSLNRDITEPSRKADQLTLDSRDTVYRLVFSVATVLCNKIEFTFCAKVEAFPRASHIL